MRVGILASHPIQYQAPWFRALAHETELKVYFAHRQSAQEQAEAGFGVPFEWDVDLLSGYSHEFLRNVSRCPSVNDFAGCDTPQIREIIAREKFDAFIVCGWYLKSFLPAAPACRRAGIPVLVRGDSQLGTTRSFLRRMVKEVTHRMLLRQFDGVLYVGKRNADYLRHYGAKAERMFFVPHFVDNAWFAAKAAITNEARARQRAQWGATGESFVALFVGKLTVKKRPLDLLQAMVPRRKDCSGVIAVFVGAGELEADLRREADALRLPICFEGFKNQSELPPYYARADVLVLPSDHGETWGLVANEAMACGLPAIVSNAVGCGPDLIDESKTGFTFLLKDTGSLGESMRRMALMNESGHDWRPALREKIAGYSVEAAARGTHRALEALRRGGKAVA